MKLRELKPARNVTKVNTKDKVRVAFQELKQKKTKQHVGYAMLMYIGKDIAQKIGLHGGDRIRFYVDAVNPRIWFVKKSDSGVGYKVRDLKRNGGKSSDTLRVQLTWKEFVPTEIERSSRSVNYDLYEGGIRVFYPHK